jgi:hypothetical protein
VRQKRNKVSLEAGGWRLERGGWRLERGAWSVELFLILTADRFILSVDSNYVKI